MEWEFLPGLSFSLGADANSVLFVTLSTVLWFWTTVYAVGYLEGSPHRSRFFGFFSLCVTATTGIALSANLITFLTFYELLTVTTYPLVVHRGTPESMRAGRTYLTYTLAGGVVLLLAVAWLQSFAGPIVFQERGALAGVLATHRVELQIVFALFILGLGVKTALVPLQGWLPQAMIAPAPVSALLHAVAVVKAGAFGIARVVYDVYGVECARDLGLLRPLVWAAALTIVYGSARALFEDELKKRLAFSTVSQVSYVVLGTAIFGQMATIGGLVHLVHQGVMKITLFFGAGNYAEELGVHRVSEMNGVGRRMPLTSAAFTVAALGMIGVPPLAGYVTKWYLKKGAIQAGDEWVTLVLGASSLMSAAYFLPILYRAWFKAPPAREPREHHAATGEGEPGEHHGATAGKREIRWMLLLPPLVTAALVIALGLLADTRLSALAWVKLIAEREYGP
jgi:multicomponent Na+:H+ antiporter subunit D